MTENKYMPEGNLVQTVENLAKMESLEALEAAMAEGAILEAVAIRANGASALTVALGDFVGIMERDEVQLTFGEPVKDIAVITRVGKPVCFKIIAIEPRKVGAPLIRLSRRAAQLECAERYLAGLSAGDVIPAKVTHLEQFGAFVDIGCGIVSLLSIDSISVSRISHPSDRMQVGSEIRVAVRGIDRNDAEIPTRIYVTRRELLGTWEENAALFTIGQTVTGIVRSIEPYGVFVELTPNLAGLAEYRGDVSVGQCAAVYIKNIIPERMKIKLVIIDAYRGIPAGIPTPELTESDHIDRWQYSPPECAKLVETVF
ncbi:MAG: 30S ribosomal protein S1 [Ruminococcaceae bacterium]|nr:30S ribosomal protein S1 [Oscillospiraceae bacterium]